MRPLVIVPIACSRTPKGEVAPGPVAARKSFRLFELRLGRFDEVGRSAEEVRNLFANLLEQLPRGCSGGNWLSAIEFRTVEFDLNRLLELSELDRAIACVLRTLVPEPVLFPTAIHRFAEELDDVVGHQEALVGWPAHRLFRGHDLLLPQGCAVSLGRVLGIGGAVRDVGVGDDERWSIDLL